MKMKTNINRRRFLEQTSTVGAAFLAIPPLARAAESAQRKVRVGVVGLGRGLDHVHAYLSLPEVEVAYVCDIDDDRIARAQKGVADKGFKAPQGVKDFRKILEDKDVDALSIATPNHWHAPMTILACAAGKHVYVEKPGSHNAREGELMVLAARRNRRVVQMGNQRRSWPGVIECVEKLRSGAIGNLLSARCWYNAARGSIGHGKVVPVPPNLDYSLWQGPAPERPYLDNLVHYNWHWRWHWGGGELANNGIHALDLARWGLGVDFPSRVTCNGGRYHFQDDQETPDTTLATFDFGTKVIHWDGSSCHPRTHENLAFVTFYGDQGSLSNDGTGYRVFDAKGKETERGSGPGGEKVHMQNFVDAIRDGKPLAAEIGEGQTSTLLCHLGNIAFRSGRTIDFDPSTRKLKGNKDAEKYWAREYRNGWEPRV